MRCVYSPLACFHFNTLRLFFFFSQLCAPSLVCPWIGPCLSFPSMLFSAPIGKTSSVHLLLCALLFLFLCSFVNEVWSEIAALGELALWGMARLWMVCMIARCLSSRSRQPTCPVFSFLCFLLSVPAFLFLPLTCLLFGFHTHSPADAGSSFPIRTKLSRSHVTPTSLF